ncbi:MAG: glycosyltransferase [Acidimicrobiales bacterium]
MDHRPQPAVSVLMPVYNGEAFLAEAVESILGQTFTDFEFVIVDDGSSDRTAQMIEEYVARDGRIRAVHQTENLGLIATLNRAIPGCRGDYIARMDADDHCDARRLERQVDHLTRNPDVGVLGTTYRFIDERGRELPDGRQLPTDPASLRWRLFFECCIAHATVLVRRDVYQSLIPYDKSFFAAEDYELWLRAAGRVRMENLESVLYYVRRHAASVTRGHWQTTGRNSERAVTVALERVLGREVGSEVSEIFLAPNHIVERSYSTEAVLRSVATLHDLAETFLSTSDLHESERAYIRRDAAKTLSYMVAACLPREPRLGLKILRESPLLPAHLALKWLAMGAARRARWEIVRRRWQRQIDADGEKDG